MIDTLARYRVFLGTLFLLLTWVFKSPSSIAWPFGLVFGLIGEALRTWASGYIFKQEKLATQGPYSIVRNPLYLGSFFLGLGITFMAGNVFFIIIYPILFFTTYMRKIELEEQHLLYKFNQEMQDYIAKVPRFIPTFKNYIHPDATWNMERALFIHKEWINWLILAFFAGTIFYYLQ